MKRTFVIAALAAGGLMLIGVVAVADEAQSKTDASNRAVKDLACLTQTGSRICAKRNETLGHGHSYTHEQILRTGATSLGGSLRLLDPSMTVR